MNAERLAKFSATYLESLTRAVNEHPEDYGFRPENVGTVHARMMQAIERGTYNKDGRAIKATCKILGIPYTYKGINGWLSGV